MKNALIALVFLLFAFNLSNAQSATQGSLEYQRGEKTAAIIELPYSSEIVQGALKYRLESATVKEERLKGLQVFKGGRLTPTDGEVVDFYFKIQRSGRKEDNNTRLYLILGRPNENVALRLLNDDFRVKDGRKFLEDLVPVVSSYKLETDIKAQDEAVKKTEKNLSTLVNDQKNLEEKIRDLQERLAQNRRDQETQNGELIKQRSTRDALVSKRVASN